MEFNRNILELNKAVECGKVSEFIAHHVHEMKRDGIIVGLSGGIDSAVAAALCVKAVGPEKVVGLILPEKDSNPLSAEYAAAQAKKLGIETETVDLTPVLQAFGTYEKRDEVVRDIFPQYNENWKMKITLPADLLNKDALNFFTLSVESDSGEVKTKRLNKKQVKGIIAATNTKQRTRMMSLYYRADKDNRLVCGTTNKSETIQGFFVQYGDGGVDIEPLAHLYKNQVYQLAEHLEVPREIIERAPSPDTYTFTVSDEEFYFRMPLDTMDYLLYAWENNVEMGNVCRVMELEEAQVKRAYRDFESKFNAGKHMLQFPPTIS